MSKLIELIAPTTAVGVATFDLSYHEYGVLVATDFGGDIANIYRFTPQGVMLVLNAAQTAEVELGMGSQNGLRISGGSYYRVNKPETTGEGAVYLALGPSKQR